MFDKEDVGVRRETPWGWARLEAVGDDHAVTLLWIRAGLRTSLHRHRLRTESWTVVHGQMALLQGPRQTNLTRTFIEKGQSAWVPRMRLHRVENAHPHQALVVLEVATGKMRADDVRRVHDDWHRLTSPRPGGGMPQSAQGMRDLVDAELEAERREEEESGDVDCDDIGAGDSGSGGPAAGVGPGS